MQFTIDATVTVDVSLRQPLTLVRALRAGDTEKLKDAITIVAFDSDVRFGDDANGDDA